MISVNSKDSSVFIVNDEWSFRMPQGFTYQMDCEFDNGIGGIDLGGSIKPMVIKGLRNRTEELFNFALEPHYNAFGNYYSVTDCKYDNRFIAESSNESHQKIIIDREDFFVDIAIENTWPFGTDLEIRIRGTNITPYNFHSVTRINDVYSFTRVTDTMKEIAESIHLVSNALSDPEITNSNITEIKTDQKRERNCIIDGTVLQKYINNESAIVLPEGLTAIADNVFSGRKDITSIVVPEGVTTVGNRAFENCFDLTEVLLPSTLKELGSYAFVDCHRLKTIYLSDSINGISNSLFSECFELENVVIPSKAEYIDAFAFKNCWKFTQIVIPEKVKYIGFSAFAGCKNLEYLYIPASVERIDINFMNQPPFEGCDALTIHCPAGSFAEKFCMENGFDYVADDTPINVEQNKTEIKERPEVLISPLEEKRPEKTQHVYSEVISAERLATKETEAKHSVEVENKKEEFESVKDKNVEEAKIVPADPTHDINNFTIVHDAVVNTRNIIKEDLIFPKGVKWISNLFKSYAEIKRIVVPEGVYGIDTALLWFGSDWRGTFEGYGVITDIYLPDSLQDFITESFDETKPLKSKNKYGDRIKVHIHHNPALERFLKKCHFVIVNEDWEDQFDYIEYISEHNEGFDIQKGTLVNCFSDEKEIIVPDGVKRIGKKAFMCMYNLEKVVLPNSLVTIEESAFKGCAHLKSIVVPGNVRKIGKQAFRDAGLETVEIGEGVATIDEEAFAWCLKLQRIQLPASLKTIGNAAFNACKALQNIKLPHGLESIETWAFARCESLDEIEFPATIRQMGEIRNNYKGEEEWNSIFGYQEDISRLILKTYRNSFADQLFTKFGIQHEIILTPEEQKEEERRQLSEVNSSLWGSVGKLYNERLEETDRYDLQSKLRNQISTVCNMENWTRILDEGVLRVPMTNMPTVRNRILSAQSLQVAYEKLSEWIADDYIQTATDNRNLKDFEERLFSIIKLSKEHFVSEFESGASKGDIIADVETKASVMIDDHSWFDTMINKYRDNSRWYSFVNKMGLDDSADSNDIIMRVKELKEQEYEDLVHLRDDKEKSINAIVAEEKALKEKVKTLGIFMFKQKKDISKQLSCIPDRIREVEADYAKKLKKYEES